MMNGLPTLALLQNIIFALAVTLRASASPLATTASPPTHSVFHPTTANSPILHHAERTQLPHRRSHAGSEEGALLTLRRTAT